MMLKYALITLALAAAALTPQDEKHIEKTVVVHGGGDNVIMLTRENDGPLNLLVNGEELVVQELAVDETRTIDTAEGPVTLSRDAEGYLLTDTEGETLRISQTGGDGFAHAGNRRHVRVVKTEDGDDQIIIRAGGDEVKVQPDAVTINGADLDEEGMAAVRAALKAAGVEKDVVFQKAPHMIWVDTQGTTSTVDGNAIFISTDEETDGTQTKAYRYKFVRKTTVTEDAEDAKKEQH